MVMELDGKVAIVTGAASGIGRATAARFAAEGARVVVADLDVRGEQVAEQLGANVRYKRTDVSKADQVAELVDFAVASFGDLHIMHNNAGISGQGFARFLDDDLADFQAIMNVDLLGVMLGTREAGRYMAKKGRGSIINTASTGGSFPGFGMLSYRAAKAAVINFSKCAAIDFGEYGIRVNSISPGPTDTEMVAMNNTVSRDVRDALRRIAIDVMLESQPLKRVGQAEDIAQAALFLASDRSAQVSGIDMVVGGGSAVGHLVNMIQQMQARMAEVLSE